MYVSQLPKLIILKAWCLCWNRWACWTTLNQHRLHKRQLSHLHPALLAYLSLPNSVMQTIKNVRLAATAWAEPQQPLTPFRTAHSNHIEWVYFTCRVISTVSDKKHELTVKAQDGRSVQTEQTSKHPVCLHTLKVTPITHTVTQGGRS